jgi:hypothetical protein
MVEPARTATCVLQGHLQRGSGTADALVDLSKDTSLRRRIQSLQRFLLQQLHREAAPPGRILNWPKLWFSLDGQHAELLGFLYEPACA